MPRIHKIRVSNIRYAEDSKRIPDIIFDAEKDNILFVLANGGGKSLLLQLILQCVLPNCKIGTRRIADMLVNTKFSGHVLIEWLLDGENANYLLTGFCFTNPSSDNKQIDFFNYTNIYDSSNRCDLHSLPLIENQTPISYLNLKKFLLDAKQPRLQIFETQKSFKDYLSQFHIYSEEWENIRVTNSEEGGVGKFFANSKTTSQFLENIALPTIETALFENNQEREVLVKSFKDHYKQMLEIPVLQKNIEDYSKISDLAEPLTQHVELHHNYKNNLEVFHKKVVGLHHYLNKNIEITQSRIHEIDSKIKDIEEDLKQCLWKIESHAYFKMILEQEALTANLESIELKLNHAHREMHTLTEENLKLQAFDLYLDISNHKKECERIEMRIEQLSEKSPELQKQLNQNLNYFAHVWRQSYKQFESEKNDLIQKMDVLKNSIQEMESEFTVQEKKEKILLQKKAVLQSWLENFQKQRQSFAEKFNSTEAENPQLAQDRLSLESEQIETKNIHLKSERTDINTKVSEHEKRIQTIIRAETLNLSDQNALKKNISLFETEHENLLGQLSLHKIVSIPDLLLHKNTVQLRIHSILAKTKEELSVISGLCANIKSKISYINDNDYFVPHPLLPAIKSQLASAGIAVVLGTEWLHAQNHLTETQKQNLVKKIPLLPFAFLAEEAQMRAIERELLAFENWEGDFPVICIPRDTAALCEQDLPSLSEQAQTIFKSETLFTAWNNEAFNSWKESLTKKLQDYLAQEKENQSHFEFLLKLETKINDFYKLYTEKILNDWKFELIKLQNAFAEFQKEKSLIENLRLSSMEKLKEIEQHLLNNEKSILDIKIQQNAVLNFMELFVRKEDKNKEYAEISCELPLLEETKSNLRNTIKAHQADFYECREKIKDFEVKLRDLNQIKTKYLLGSNIKEEKNTFDYSVLLNKIETLNESLKSQQQDIVELTKSLQKSSLYLKKDQTRLDEIFASSSCLTLDFVIKQSRTVNNIEKEEIKKNISEKEKSISLIKKEKENLSISLYKIYGVLDEIKRNINLRFNQENPYSEFNKNNHTLVLTSLQKEQAFLNQNISDISSEKIGFLKFIEDAKKSVHWIGNEINNEYLISADFTWDENEISEINTEPLKFSQHVLKQYSENKNVFEKQKLLVLKAFDDFLLQLKRCNNNNLYDFIRETENVLGESRLFDYQYVCKTFLHIKESVKYLKDQSVYRLEQLELNRLQIIERVSGRVKEIYKDLFEIARNTKITLYERVLNLVKIDAPAWQDQEAKGSISAHLNSLIEEIIVLESSGKNEDDISKFIDSTMTSKFLLNKIIGLEKIKVSVFKPRQESMLKDNKIDYLRWDEIERWSGGEKFCAYMGMFLALTSYMRGRTSGSATSWRVLLADNPFGIASSKHILDPVFTMAATNRIQLVCFTAHSADEILKRFKSVYSLKLIPAFGREHMRYEKIEKGFYIAPAYSASLAGH